jgi:hypothetical protein
MYLQILLKGGINDDSLGQIPLYRPLLKGAIIPSQASCFAHTDQKHKESRFILAICQLDTIQNILPLL